MSPLTPRRRLLLALAAAMSFTATSIFVAYLLMGESPLSALWQSLFVTITTTVIMTIWYRRHGQL